MAEPAKPKTGKAKPAAAVHKRHTLEHRSFDIMPKHKAHASATSRPVVTGNKPQHRDSTLTSKHEAPGAHLSRHKTTVQPLTPAGAAPTPPTAAPAPVATTPAPTSSATPPVPATPAASHVPTPAFPDLQPAAPLPPSPVPDVAAPVREEPVPDELALANLPGLHQDEEAVQATAPVAASAGTPAASAATATPAAHPVNQTPEQARELAAALNDLKRHPAAPPSDAPVVVVHQHDYLRMILLFFGFAIIGVAVVLIAFDLLIDAGILQVPFEAPTNFFN